MKIAGRYMGDIAKKAAMNPYTSAAGLGGLAAGGATLGNIVSGEAADEGAGRLALEALGAGALGAYVGSQIPAAKANVMQAKRRAAQSLRDSGAGQNVTVDPTTGKAYKTVGVAENAGELRDAARQMMKGADIGLAGSTALATLGAGGLGGMLGGGVANVGQLVGIPGLTQDQAMQMAAQQAINPEGYGSSNSQGARYKAPTTQYV